MSPISAPALERLDSSIKSLSFPFNPKDTDKGLCPISLPPVLIKILESFVFKWIYEIVSAKIDTLINWCADFLCQRYFRVKIGENKSAWKSTHAGVPRDTKLGPLQFLVMINDLTSDLPLYKYL